MEHANPKSPNAVSNIYTFDSLLSEIKLHFSIDAFTCINKVIIMQSSHQRSEIDCDVDKQTELLVESSSKAILVYKRASNQNQFYCMEGEDGHEPGSHSRLFSGLIGTGTVNIIDALSNPVLIYTVVQIRM